MIECPECRNPLYLFSQGEWSEWICWKCGHYESNSPAYRSNPALFVNLVRDNPMRFFKRKLAPDESLHRDDPTNTGQNLVEEALRAKSGGHGGIWTHDLLITSQPLCQAELHDLVLAVLAVHN